MKIKEFIPIIFILLAAAFLRLLWLDRVPGAINGDELHYLLTIKSVALSGHDFASSWNILPIIFFRYPPGQVQAELPYFLLFIPVGFLNASLVASRIVYSLISVGTVFVMYLLGRKIFNEKVGLIAAALCAINPWQIFMGRTAYEVVPASFFYLLAIYFLIKERGGRIYFSIPLFILAFYSYIGTKIILVPIVLVVCAYAYFLNKKKYLREYLIVTAVAVLLTIFFAAMAYTGGNTRTGELYNPYSQKVTEQVNILRKASIAHPENLSEKLINNRFTIYANDINSRMFDALSFKSTFSETDTFVSLYGTGFFFFLDAIFLILGALYLFADKRREFYLVACLIFLGTLPHVLFISGSYFSPHLVLFYLFLILPIAYGIAHVISKGRIVLIAIGVLYILSFIRFANIYFFEFPKQGHFDFPARELSNYIALSSKKGPVDVFVKSPKDIFSKYIYYSNSLNQNNYQQIESAFKSNKYNVANIRFINCGDIAKEYNKNATTIYQGEICDGYDNGQRPLKITRLLDGGEIYRIFGDKICLKYNLNTYPQNIKLEHFSVEHLSPQIFCETFITR